tara:strand:+ start:52681 stop:53859 length:1179 start_codon:yes stop_codon:yes gene_type:complete
MKIITFILLTLLLSCTESDSVFEKSNYECSQVIDQNNQDHPKSKLVSNIMKSMISKGVPGILMTVHTNENGYFSDALGKSDIASNININDCNITRVGSTVKTFTAVTILKLQEEGKLKLDDLINLYLPENVLKDIENADKVTIRQLLNHSSGIYNYIQDLKFQTASLNDFKKVWKVEELLDYARKRNAYFSPGDDVIYSNTNYIFLGMIIEVVEGKHFYEVFKDKIFNPLPLNFTQFAAIDPVPDNIIRGYIDIYSNLNLINSTYNSGWDYFSADGGLISNAFDLNVFLTNLFQGNILSDTSLKEMMTWTKPKKEFGDGFETSFGLGIFKIETNFGPAYLHSGDAIGYFASMVYFPNQKTTITWAVNANYGKMDEIIQSKKSMEFIFKTLLE